MTLRAASIGLGWWSDELAMAVHGKSDSIRIASCFSRSPDKRAAFAEKFGAGQHESYEAVLGDPEIDAVLLTTPHSLHGEHIRMAAAAGKHVFVEKPFTLSAEDGRAAAAACRDAGVVLATGHNRRFAPATIALKRRIESGEFGTLLHAEGQFSTPTALSMPPERWRASRGESPGGAIGSLGIHTIDAMTHLMGPVARLTCFATRRAVSVDIDDTTSALFEFATGATGYLGTLFATPYTNFLNVYGTKAAAEVSNNYGALTVRPAEGEAIAEPLAPVETLRVELEEFAAACAGTATYRVTPEEAIHNVAVMEAMVASAASSGTPQAVG